MCRVNRVCECDWLLTEFPTRRRIVASVRYFFFYCCVCCCLPKVVLSNLFSFFFFSSPLARSLSLSLRFLSFFLLNEVCTCDGSNTKKWRTTFFLLIDCHFCCRSFICLFVCWFYFCRRCCYCSSLLFHSKILLLNFQFNLTFVHKTAHKLHAITHSQTHTLVRTPICCIGLLWSAKNSSGNASKWFIIWRKNTKFQFENIIILQWIFYGIPHGLIAAELLIYTQKTLCSHAQTPTGIAHTEAANYSWWFRGVCETNRKTNHLNWIEKLLHETRIWGDGGEREGARWAV